MTMFKNIQRYQHNLCLNRYTVSIIFMLCMVPSLIVIACTTDTATPIEDNSISQENAAPSFSLKLTNGDTFNYQNTSEIGPPIFLFFFSPYCGTCRGELNELKTVQPLYDNDVTFIAVDIDVGANLEELRMFANEQDYPWEVGISSSALLEELSILTQSTKIAIDRDGIVIYRKGFAEGNLEEWISVFESLSS